jgi:hypothetical protein
LISAKGKVTGKPPKLGTFHVTSKATDLIQATDWRKTVLATL